MTREINMQSLFKKWIVKRPKGMCQILFSLTELDNFCDEIREKIFEDKVLDILDIIKQQEKKSVDVSERNGYAHSYAIVKGLLETLKEVK